MSGRPPFRDDIVYDEEGPQRRKFPRRSADQDPDEDSERPQTGALPARATRELESRRAAGEVLEPILPNHPRNLATTFWGMAWNRYLMECADYASRLPRGRTAHRRDRQVSLPAEGRQAHDRLHSHYQRSSDWEGKDFNERNGR
jgi:hypothetical protein